MSTGGAGSGVFKPISGQESAPNAFEGAHSVMLTPDRQFLFATKGDHGAAGYDHGLVRSRQADARVGTVLPLEQARTAHEMLGGAPHSRGKIVLNVAGGSSRGGD